MSSKLQKHRAKFHQEATKIRNDLTEFQRKLAGRSDLDQQTRQRAFLRAHEEAAALMADVKVRYDAALQGEMTSLRRQMWSLPDGDSGSAFAKMSYRDAVTKAMAVKDGDEAMALLDIAEQMGDVHMVRALGLVGQSKPWGSPVHQRLYDSDERLRRLMDAHDELEHAATNVQERIKDAAMFAPPDPGSPREPEAPDLASDWRGDSIPVPVVGDVLAG